LLGKTGRGKLSTKDIPEHLAEFIFMAVFDGQPITECNFTEPVCLVIGNEAVGVTRSILRLGTGVTIAQRSADISYNASVAAGILLFQFGIKNKRI